MKARTIKIAKMNSLNCRQGAQGAGPNHVVEQESLFDFLPDVLVVDIFSRLSDAKTVQILAACCARFRKLCTQIPGLSFEDAPEGSTSGEFERVIGCMLARLETGSLRRLTIGNEDRGGLGICLWEEAVKGWVALVKESLEDLTIVEFREDSDRTDLNHRLQLASCCFNLKKLMLTGSLVTHLVDATLKSLSKHSFQHLRLLDIERIHTSMEALQELVSHCPILETLRIQDLRGVENFHLRSSSLTSFFLAYNAWLDDDHLFGIKTVALATPCLKSATVSGVSESLTINATQLTDLYLDEFQDGKIDLGDAFSSLETLVIKPCFWPPSRKGIRARWSWSNFESLLRPTDPRNLRGLHVPFLEEDIMYTAELPTTKDVRQMFEHMVQLEELTLCNSFLGACNFTAAPTRQKNIANAMAGLTFVRLHTVGVLIDIAEDYGLSTFLAALMGSSAALVSVCVDCRIDLQNPPLRGSFLTKLVNLQRSFPKVVIELLCADRVSLLNT